MAWRVFSKQKQETNMKEKNENEKIKGHPER